MPLTPTDVANKQFRIAFRGYSLDEVDAFLDEVETELSRLLRDNAELKSRPASPAATVPAPTVPEPTVPEPTAAPNVPTAPPAPVAPPAAEPLRGLEGQEAALRTLLLAQRTADLAIAEARAEADQMRAEARTETDGVLTAAREEAQSLLTAARTEAESTLASSTSRAARLDAEVAAQIKAATGDLDDRRRSLEVRIEELRAFEREYRTRLQAYLETQLRDLGSRGGADDDGGAGVPVGARAAAVGADRSRVVATRPLGAVPVRQAPDAATPPGTPPTGADGAGAPDGPPHEPPLSGRHASAPPTTAPPTAAPPTAAPPTTEEPARQPVGPFRTDPWGGAGPARGGPPSAP